MTTTIHSFMLNLGFLWIYLDISTIPAQFFHGEKICILKTFAKDVMFLPIFQDRLYYREFLEDNMVGFI